MIWQVQTAKQKFSELIRRAHREGPQIITRHGREVAVLLSPQDFRRLTASASGFKAFLRSGPDLSELPLERDPTPYPIVALE